MQHNQTQKVNHDNDEGVDQFLTFFMDDEEYGVDILSVQEIRGWESVTPLPNSEPHIKGVINLRGNIVPIIDLRQCFGLKSIHYSNLTVVIILKILHLGEERVMGIVVDAVSDVYALSQEELRPAPHLGDSLSTDAIKGLVNINDSMVILLNIDRMLSLDKLPRASEIQSKINEQDV